MAGTKKDKGAVLRFVARGYLGLFKAALEWGMVCLALVALSAAIVWPLWFFATKSPGWYALAMGVAALCVLCICVALYARRAMARGETGLSVARKIFRVPCLIVVWAVLLLSAYVAFTLFSHGRFLMGLIPTGLCLALCGYLFFGRGLRRR
jgi:hypothetical protein